MERNRWLRALLVLLTFIAALHLAGLLWDLGQRFGDIIVMFFLAWLLAFVLSPITQALERTANLTRVLAAAAVYMVLFVVLLSNTLNYMRLSAFHIDVVKGAIILAAALLDVLRTRLVGGRT